MKKTFKEDLERIHELTYGKKVINESNFIDKILSNIGIDSSDKKTEKVDDPKKADLVSSDVESFFTSLKNAVDSGGLEEKSHGDMNYQKEVESMQIGLMILGYDLPRHGVDGLFGPETAAAVEKFKSDNNIKDGVNESADAIRQIAIGKYGWKEKSGQLSGGGEISSDLSKIVNELIAEFNEKYPECVGTFTSGNDVFHQKITSYTSLHTKGLAVDLTLPSSCHSSFIELLKQYKSKYNGFSFIDEYTNPTKLATGGHFHVSYRKGKPEGGGKSSGGSGSVSVSKIKATPEMLNIMIDMLRQKGVTSEELKKYIDMVKTGGSAAFTDLDLTTDEGYKKYAEICQKFINNRPPNLLGITGEMMAKGAKEAFDRYKRFVPAELALAQLAAEGGIGNKDPNSRPIRTKNPFNVGNTDSGANIEHGQVQSGINAYYNLIAKNYLGKGKTASDLIQNFVNHNGNRYASATGYESSLNKLAGEANRVAQTVTSSTT